MEDVYEKRESSMSWLIISKHMRDVPSVFDVVTFEAKSMYKVLLRRDDLTNPENIFVLAEFKLEYVNQ